MVNNEKQTSAAFKTSIKMPALIAAAVFAVLAVCYGGVALFLNNKFCIGTVINNINCSAKTVEEAEGLISQMADNYALTIEERNDKTETISSDEIGLKNGAFIFLKITVTMLNLKFHMTKKNLTKS